MPPKFKFTREQIVQAALDIIRHGGWKALTTRSLADALDSSARPIYSYFKSMEALESDVSKKAVDLLYDYMIQKRTGDPWHDHGIGYVLFAQEEKQLFTCLNDPKRIRYFKQFGDQIWKTLTDSLSGYPPFRGLSGEQIYQVQLARWLMAHGLAALVSSTVPEGWDNERLIATMQQNSTAILDGLRKQFASAEA